MAQVYEHLEADVHSVMPATLTILATYKCTAACAQCCFESSPKLITRLSLETICARIDEAKENFPALNLVVFSGGECFLLKDDLYAAIAHATKRGLLTRCVTNGFWGKSPVRARHVVEELKRVGLKEINFSTGLDHQKWVPLDSVANACSATVSAGLRTALSIETDTDSSDCYKGALEHPLIKSIVPHAKFLVLRASWMPFHASADSREKGTVAGFHKGCKQLFGNLVVTPHDFLSACCGLTLEHIPEMKLGRLGVTPMRDLFDSQFEDFLKIWIHVDGPHVIVKRLFGDQGDAALANVVHICQACTILHKNPAIVAELKSRYLEFVPEVMARFNISLALAKADRSVISLRNNASVKKLNTLVDADTLAR